MIAIIVFAIMLSLMLVNVPIAVCTGLATLAGVYFTSDLRFMVVTQRMFVGLDTFTLIAVPLFILTGRLMALGGITRDLILVSKALVGFMKGGLAYINIVASMLFAGITGSAASDTSSIGGILIPAMIDKGYHKDFSVAVTATSSTIGIMIPPSIPMVVYSVSSNASVGKLFIGGIIPGVMVGVVLMIVTAIMTKRRNYPRDESFTWGETIVIVLKGIPAMLSIFIILGGIVLGIFTPTEAAGVAVFYSYLLGRFYYKELRLSDIPGIMAEVSITTGQVALMIATASALGFLFSHQGVPAMIARLILDVTGNKFALLLLINALLLFVGTWLDLTPAVIIFAPIFLPIVMDVGVDPVHFGVIMVVNLAIGLFTPPVGVCLFVACGIARISISSTVRAFIPFFLAMVVVLLLITYIEPLVLFLPNLLM
ncbi:MAG: TRAP transporter large permease [Planctomycetota bacterium]|jgi:C4-dicarboxylate transporter DctM subunit|nr:TRAP transporter large permease [Planctomycetota bacterium]